MQLDESAPLQERKGLSDTMECAEANRARARLNMAISRQLRNELTVIQASVDLLGFAHETRSSETMQQQFNALAFHLWRVKSTVRMIETGARLEYNDDERLSLREAVAESAAWLERSLPSGSKISVEEGYDDAIVTIDRARLLHAFLLLGPALVEGTDGPPIAQVRVSRVDAAKQRSTLMHVAVQCNRRLPRALIRPARKLIREAGVELFSWGYGLTFSFRPVSIRPARAQE